MHPNAAGIDIGSVSHYVAVSPDQSDEPVKEFGCFTEDIEAMADWLAQCGRFDNLFVISWHVIILFGQSKVQVLHGNNAYLRRKKDTLHPHGRFD